MSYCMDLGFAFLRMSYACKIRPWGHLRWLSLLMFVDVFCVRDLLTVVHVDRAVPALRTSCALTTTWVYLVALGHATSSSTTGTLAMEVSPGLAGSSAHQVQLQHMQSANLINLCSAAARLHDKAG